MPGAVEVPGEALAAALVLAHVRPRARVAAEMRVQPPALVEGGAAAGKRADERAGGGRAPDAAAGGRGRASVAAAAGHGRAPDAAAAAAARRGLAPRRRAVEAASLLLCVAETLDTGFFITRKI